MPLRCCASQLCIATGLHWTCRFDNFCSWAAHHANRSVGSVLVRASKRIHPASVGPPMWLVARLVESRVQLHDRSSAPIRCGHHRLGWFLKISMKLCKNNIKRVRQVKHIHMSALSLGGSVSVCFCLHCLECYVLGCAQGRGLWENQARRAQMFQSVLSKLEENCLCVCIPHWNCFDHIIFGDSGIRTRVSQSQTWYLGTTCCQGRSTGAILETPRTGNLAGARGNVNSHCAAKRKCNGIQAPTERPGKQVCSTATESWNSLKVFGPRRMSGQLS